MSSIAEPTPITTYDDGRFIRTAVVAVEKGSSFDLVDEDGKRLAVINAFVYRSDDGGEVNHLILDVIDVDDRFALKFALLFNDGTREFLPTNGNLVCADFRTEDYAIS